MPFIYATMVTTMMRVVMMRVVMIMVVVVAVVMDLWVTRVMGMIHVVAVGTGDGSGGVIHEVGMVRVILLGTHSVMYYTLKPMF